MHIPLIAGMPEVEQLSWLRELQAALPEATWHMHPVPPDIAPQVRVAVVANPWPGALAGLPNLQWIQSLWAGVDKLLADPTLPPMLPISRMVDPSLSAAMVEASLWAVISLQRDFFAYATQQRNGTWHQRRQRRADEISVAVLGLGEMGRNVARHLVPLGYHVTGWTRTAPAAVPAGVKAVAGNDALYPLLGKVDIVVNLLPLTPATRGLLNARFFAAMRSGAAVVNFARGQHVVDDDLLAALDGGHLGHAILDVFHTEPLPPSHRYWRHPRITVLPHVAARTDPATASRRVAENIRSWLSGGPIANLVDRSRWY